MGGKILSFAPNSSVIEARCFRAFKGPFARWVVGRKLPVVFYPLFINVFVTFVIIIITTIIVITSNVNAIVIVSAIARSSNRNSSRSTSTTTTSTATKLSLLPDWKLWRARFSDFTVQFSLS